MCGIFGFLATESKPDLDLLQTWVKYAKIRGQDGFGFVLIKPDETWYEWKGIDCKNVNVALKQIHDKLQVGDLLLGICRNAPETEGMTTSRDYLQPILYGDEKLAMVHNGAITSMYVEKFKSKKRTPIDSEVILLSYLEHGRNLKEALESISGSWSAIIWDGLQKRLHIVSSHVQLAHGYIRGLGYLVHSDLQAIKETVARFKGLQDIKFTRLWEDFYYNELEPYTIYSIDYDSLLVTKKSYKHHFVHPVWKEQDNLGTAVVVLASGGIDSTTTLLVLKEAGISVYAFHVRYGHKSQEAETLAIKKITEYLNVPLIIANLEDFYKQISESSMLLNDELEITTGTKNRTKTVQAWTPGRNFVFATLAGAFAEELILSNKFSKVYIAGGFPNITEEVYPDNTNRFVQSWLYTGRFGYLAGAQKRIGWFNLMAGLTKKEELWLMKRLGYEELFGLTVSCDRAKVIDGEVRQCWCTDKNGISLPACGSGKLSYFAAKLVGIKDTRKYYEVNCGENYEHYIPEWFKQETSKIDFDPDEILKRLTLPEEVKPNVLRELRRKLLSS